jgi:glycine hydroxymethyltransferase
VTSGLRLGTAAVTTAGMGEPEMGEIANLIATVLRKTGDDVVAGDVRDAANRLCSKYTPYPELAGT